MELLSINETTTGLCIEGFPDAVKVIKIKGPKAQRLCDLARHKADLDFAKRCLDYINSVLNFPDCDFLQQSLWQTREFM